MVGVSIEKPREFFVSRRWFRIPYKRLAFLIIDSLDGLLSIFCRLNADTHAGYWGILFAGPPIYARCVGYRRLGKKHADLCSSDSCLCLHICSGQSQQADDILYHHIPSQISALCDAFAHFHHGRTSSGHESRHWADCRPSL